MAFRGFPDEIWQIILGFLNTEQDAHTIRALRATSRSLRELVHPLFRCDIKLDSKTFEDNDSYLSLQLQQRVWKIVEDLTIARVLTGLEVKFRFRTGFYGKNGALLENREPKKFYEPWMTHAIVTPELARKISDGLQLESHSAQVAFLLAICPNIDMFHLTHFDTYPNTLTLYDMVLEQALAAAHQACLNDAQPEFPLQNLRSLTLGYTRQPGLKDILKLLPLPSLTYCEVAGLGDTEGHWWHLIPAPLKGPYRNQNPLELVLDSSMLSGKGLGCLLQSCVQPKALTMRWRTGLWNEHFKNSSIGWAIRRYGQSLEYLHLDSTSMGDFNHRRSGPPEPFGTFKSLTKLKVLAVPGYAFWKPARSFRFTDDANDDEDTDEEEEEEVIEEAVSEHQEANGDGDEDEEVSSPIADNEASEQNIENIPEAENQEDREPASPDPEDISTPVEAEEDSSLPQEEESTTVEVTNNVDMHDAVVRERLTREAYPSSPKFAAGLDNRTSDVLELNALPPSLEQIYVLGCYPDHYIYRPRSKYYNYRPYIYECEVETLRSKCNRRRRTSQRPLKINTVPWRHFYVGEHFGNVHHRDVKYDEGARSQWPQRRISCDPKPGDGFVEVY